eukprot:TRINITY_DN8673_c0_g1_i1.p2 TRINITY_DN8673_c0_g1~~TRINITY_DN8673_c0_g1_i1.p2  ORF type:complete len:513 (+),score=156.74 TRINITY_DN8673_c0_g1_i1:58-1596(+)
MVVSMEVRPARPQSSRPAASRKAATPRGGGGGEERRPFHTAYTAGQFGWPSHRRPYSARAAPADLPKWGNSFAGLKKGGGARQTGGDCSLYMTERSNASTASGGSFRWQRPQTARVVMSSGWGMEPCPAAERPQPAAATAAFQGEYAPPTPPTLASFTRNVASTRNRNTFHNAARAAAAPPTSTAPHDQIAAAAAKKATAADSCVSPPSKGSYAGSAGSTPQQRAAGHSHGASHEADTECEMCDFVKGELDTFDLRRRAKVALSISNTRRMIRPNFQTRALPPLVQSLHQHEMRAKSEVVQRLAARGMPDLKRRFAAKMRADGSISKADFVDMLTEATECSGAKAKTAILKFYDSFTENRFTADVGFVTFFMQLERYTSPAVDPRVYLSDAWGILRGATGPVAVTVFELQALLSSVAAFDAPLAAKIRNALSTHASLTLYQNGECNVKELVAAVEASPFLHRVFTAQPNPSYLAQLEDELKNFVLQKKKSSAMREASKPRLQRAVENAAQAS